MKRKHYAGVIVSLLFFCSLTLCSEEPEQLNIKKMYSFCKSTELSIPIRIFDGYFWIPSEFMFNTERSIKEKKIIYTNFCGAFNGLFNDLYHDSRDYPFSEIELGDISECDICNDSSIKELSLHVDGLTKKERLFKYFKMKSINVTINTDHYTTVVIFNDNRYLRFFEVDMKQIEKGIEQFEKFKLEIETR